MMMCALLGKGGSVQHVLIPGEYKTIVIRGQLNQASIDDAIRKSESCGKITGVSNLKDFPLISYFFQLSVIPMMLLKQ